MKVAILAPLPPPVGGIGTWALRVKTSMSRQCQILLVDEGLIGGREFFGENAKKKLFDEVRRCVRIWSDLWRCLNDKEVEIVHSNIPAVPGGMLREIVCALISKLRNKKFIIHYRCTVSQSIDANYKRLLLKVLSNLADAVIVLNEKSKQYVEKVSTTPISLIPNFITSDEFEQRKEWRAEIKSVLYVGGVCKDKGIYDFYEVAKVYPTVRFIAIGKIEEGANEAAPSNVVLTGPKAHSEIDSYRKDADVFIFLSHYKHEGFSNALAEAMASSLPCIVTDWAANADMIGAEGGYVVPVKEAGVRAAECLGQLMINKKTRESFGQRNYQKCLKEYSEERVIDEYLKLYRSLM